MPLVKRGGDPPPPVIGEDDLHALTEALGSPDAERRWGAARALSGRAEAVPVLAAALRAEPSPRVQEAITTALMRVGDRSSVAALLPYLRSPDAGRRGAAIEALQALPDVTAPFMPGLLEDGDADVRILSIELVRGMPATTATDLLCGLLEREQHPNVCAAAVEVLAEVGTSAALPALRACARRFAETPFLPFAISTAIARISDVEG